ncbi:uncharacterized protein EI97DRAFT_500849 [Westerdykella ornata]|uniref:Uncharacterized protein n=1 Tax=Westerdykella ornata TaxID=318751 RepID=A0A6A6JKT0_WESOR|nr:uncharacterized protein EI97DRAFT_500849 [Westerdykella ornata]KAF2277260.1 hypothetical protein EI97DRAFT_500849 [Westerdykella ornata]
MLDAKSLVYVLPLTLLSPIALNYGKRSGHSLFPLQRPSEAPRAVDQGLLSACAAHPALSVVTVWPTATTSASADPVLATNEPSEAKPEVKPKVQKPKYTCPENEGREENIFFCVHCGGAKEGTPWRNDGVPNAKCVGLSNGMWEDCLCYEEPPQTVFPLVRGNRGTKKGLKEEWTEKSLDEDPPKA